MVAPAMNDTRRPLVSCSPWALLLVLLVAAAFFGSRLAAPFLRPTHDPDATPRTVAARGDLASDEQSTIELFRGASPSVVHIDTRTRVYDRWTLTPFDIPIGTGSGFVWDERGYVVTNFHVILDEARRRTAEPSVFLDGSTKPLQARIVGQDPEHDIAVLKIESPGEKLRAIPVGTSKDLQVGQKVFAIGNPFGLDHTLTTGIISGLGREIASLTGAPIRDVIQTDAAINPGNSGGPLLDSAGRLIGMNTAIATPGGGVNGQGFNVGVGFAVPVDTINKIVPSLIRKGNYQPPALGIRSAPEQMARAMRVEGVVVQSVQPGSGAESAGVRSMQIAQDGAIEAADVITKVDGESVSSVDDIHEILSNHKPGDVVSVEILRGGKPQRFDIKLSE
jgi:S1-C subfamily serine protease